MVTFLEVWPLMLAAVAAEEANGRVGALRGRLSHLAGSMSSMVLEEVDLDAVLENVDLNALLEGVDLNAVFERVDVNALFERVDVNALFQRVDVNGLFERVDVNGLFERVDVNGLVSRMDANVLLRELDFDDLLQRVDLQLLLNRIDLDALFARVDVAAVVDRVDVDRVVARLDLKDMAARAGIPDIVADSTSQLAGSALDLGRRQLVGIDIALHRALSCLLGRDPDALVDGPATLVAGEHFVAVPDPDSPRRQARAHVTGFYAGPVTRLLAFWGDVALATTMFTLGAAGASWLLGEVLGLPLPDPGDRPWLSAIAIATWFFLYWGVSAAVAGRTPVKALTGLRIVSRDGTPLRPGSAFLRTAMMPLSLLVFGAGAAWMLFDRERRTLHDIGGGSAVVYDWGGRAAQMPTPMARWIETHGGAPPVGAQPGATGLSAAADPMQPTPPGTIIHSG